MTYYAGDLTPDQAWQMLEEEPESVLVDIRPRAEWFYVGVPVLDDLDKRPVMIELTRFPTGERNVDFVQELMNEGIRTDQPVVFLCRSGNRSAGAAAMAAEAGYQRAYNIAEGFEGVLDGQGHRGSMNGWKVRGLPWRQA